MVQNKHKTIKNNKNAQNRLPLYITVGIICVIAIIAALELTNTTHFFHKSPVTSTPSPVITHITTGTSPNTGDKQISSTPTLSQGSSVDNNGIATTTTSSGQWTTSQSGIITVKQPIANSVIKTGVTISGAASVGQVQYTLIDDQKGVISQGTINVVNGSFSADISFQSYAPTGRLDVFSTDSSGRELNLVQLPVRF